MAVVIKWTDEAKSTFGDNIDYLLKVWTEREIKIFIKLTKDILSRIEEHPEMFAPSTKNPKIRRAFINKYIVLYYRYYPIKKEAILLTFWHSRQDPKKLKY